ncbi:MAG: aquaporin [Phycisphaerales bacterium]|nr:aquaporin [Phycisphaerales bacterium]
MSKLVSGSVAEFLGTFALTFFGAGAIIMASTPGGGGNLVTVALAHGLVLFAFIAGCGYISGGQFNPAVALGLVVAGKQTPVQAAVYIVAQLLGAACGAGMLQLLLTPEIANSQAAKLGATIGALTTTEGATLRVIGMEAIMTFALMFVVLSAAVDERGGKLGALAIGVTVTGCILAGGYWTGASMNPARSFGPAICGSHWVMFHAYIIGPVVGASLAAVVYRVFWKR